MTLNDILDFYYIDTIDRSTTAVGMEIELPIVPIGGGIVSAEFAAEITDFLSSLGFIPQQFTRDGYACELQDKTGDSISFETSWNTIEFSIKFRQDLFSLLQTYKRILIPLQNFCMEKGYYLCGRGINPNYPDLDPSPLNTEVLQAKSEFLAKYTNHHDGEIFHALCASVQTHLDAVDKASYLKLFRLLRRAYVFEALLFANSLPVDISFTERHPALKSLKRDTLCYRDELWKFCGAPNVILSDDPLETIDDFRNYLRAKELFVIKQHYKIVPIPATPMTDYCRDPDWQPETLSCFRSLEPVAPTKHGTLEIRSTCVQPLDAMLQPAAFYTGLSVAVDEAARHVDEIYRKHFPGLSPVQVRDALMQASNAPLRKELKEDVETLLNISRMGLQQRGLGEEKLLTPLTERLAKNNWQVPAQCLQKDPLTQTKEEMNRLEGRN